MPPFADLRTPQQLNEYILVLYSPNVIITIFNNSLQEACGVTNVICHIFFVQATTNC